MAKKGDAEIRKEGRKVPLSLTSKLLCGSLRLSLCGPLRWATSHCDKETCTISKVLVPVPPGPLKLQVILGIFFLDAFNQCKSVKSVAKETYHRFHRLPPIEANWHFGRKKRTAFRSQAGAFFVVFSHYYHGIAIIPLLPSFLMRLTKT